MMNEFLKFNPDSSQLAAFSVYCLIYLMIMMIILAMRVYSSQRSVAYIFFIIGLSFVLLDRIIMLSDLNDTLQSQHWFGIGRASHLALSYILLNFAVLRLYKRMNNRMRTRFIMLILGVPVMALISFMIIWDDQSTYTLYWPVIIYQMISTVFCFLWIAPRINQRIPYLLSLLMYNIYLVLVMVNALFYNDANILLISIKHVISLMFYSILFIIFFERIVENLHSTYRTSISDGLTGLYNKNYMYQRMNRHFNQRSKYGAVIFCDLDNFKKLNDTEGHMHADEVLKKAAQIIREEVDDDGLAGRFGGEELIAFIANNQVSPTELAETMRIRIEKEAGVTGSFGISVYKKGITVDELVHQADEAMYSSKQRGKNRITSYEQLNNNNNAMKSG